MLSSEIRKRYLEFFEKKGHKVIESSSLIPEDDQTTLFVSSGMQPLVPYLMGKKHSLGTRLVNSQKCFRAEDIEEVGDGRHTTFFEMLGNWSLGDYFKQEQLSWIFEFLIDEIGLDPNRLYVSVFRGNKEIGVKRDDESVKIWQELFIKRGIKADAVDMEDTIIQKEMGNTRIFFYNEAKNWWSRSGIPQDMPIGEIGGPDSEIFYDFGIELDLHKKSKWADKPCHINCDCGRFIEIGNSVFIEYIKTKDDFEKLKQKNVDFGGGLERIAMVTQNKSNIFEIDLLFPAYKEIEKLSGKSFYFEATKSPRNKVLAKQGSYFEAKPKNKVLAKQGSYFEAKPRNKVLAKQGSYNSIKENSIKDRNFEIIIDHLRAVVFILGDKNGNLAVPSNTGSGYLARRLIRRVIRSAKLLELKVQCLSDVALILIDNYKKTYPELEKKREFILNELRKEIEKFDQTLQKGLQEFEKIIEKKQSFNLDGKEAFNLYQTYGFPIEIIQEIADERGIKVDMVEFKEEIKKHCELSKISDSLFKGGLIDAKKETIELHTTTHLLLAALRKVLDKNIEQKGSNITRERLRFDFNYEQKLTDEEKDRIEKLINSWIKEGARVEYKEMSVEKAKEIGAIATFISRYDEMVKVYTITKNDGEIISREICGGPHIEDIKELGVFEIKKEESVSAGIRRIRAVVIHNA